MARCAWRRGKRTGRIATIATTIAAGAIGGQGANIGGAAHTFVHVNNSLASEALTGANILAVSR